MGVPSRTYGLQDTSVMLPPKTRPLESLKCCIARQKGPAHGASLRGGNQLSHHFAVVHVRNICDVGSNEPVGKTVHLGSDQT